MTKLRPAAAPRSQPVEVGLGPRVLADVGHAVAELAAGGVVARADAGEAEADVEDAVPVVQPDPAVDAELEQLDGVDVPLDEVGVDRLGVAAVGVEGEPALLAASRGRRRP